MALRWPSGKLGKMAELQLLLLVMSSRTMLDICVLLGARADGSRR